MPQPQPEVLDFLLSRRSRPAKTLDDTAPGRAQIIQILQAGARVPDHGMLSPWRFVVIAKPAQERLVTLAARHARAQGLDQAACDKAAGCFAFGGLIIAVIAAPCDDKPIPHWEQALSAGAVCLSVLNAALALGWGANWLTGPLARNEAFLAEAFGCQPGEYVAGFIHIGAQTVAPAERARPDIETLSTWL